MPTYKDADEFARRFLRIRFNTLSQDIHSPATSLYFLVIWEKSECISKEWDDICDEFGKRHGVTRTHSH